VFKKHLTIRILSAGRRCIFFAPSFSFHEAENLQIREYTKDNLEKVFDCISEGDSPKIDCDAISSRGGTISYILGAKHDRKDVENKHTLAYSVTGEGFKYGPKYMEAKPEDFEFSKKYLSPGMRVDIIY
jgi:hypothetical protein